MGKNNTSLDDLVSIINGEITAFRKIGIEFSDYHGFHVKNPFNSLKQYVNRDQRERSSFELITYNTRSYSCQPDFHQIELIECFLNGFEKIPLFKKQKNKTFDMVSSATRILTLVNALNTYQENKKENCPSQSQSVNIYNHDHAAYIENLVSFFKIFSEAGIIFELDFKKRDNNHFDFLKTEYLTIHLEGTETAISKISDTASLHQGDVSAAVKAIADLKLKDSSSDSHYNYRCLAQFDTYSVHGLYQKLSGEYSTWCIDSMGGLIDDASQRVHSAINDGNNEKLTGVILGTMCLYGKLNDLLVRHSNSNYDSEPIVKALLCLEESTQKIDFSGEKHLKEASPLLIDCIQRLGVLFGQSVSTYQRKLIDMAYKAEVLRSLNSISDAIYENNYALRELGFSINSGLLAINSGLQDLRLD